MFTCLVFKSLEHLLIFYIKVYNIVFYEEITLLNLIVNYFQGNYRNHLLINKYFGHLTNNAIQSQAKQNLRYGY